MEEKKKYPYTVEPNIIKLAPNYYRVLIKKGSGKNQQVFSEYVRGKITEARAIKRKGFAELENKKKEQKIREKPHYLNLVSNGYNFVEIQTLVQLLLQVIKLD